MPSSYSLTALMSLALPTVGVDSGPEWATLLNQNFGLLDTHDHSSGKGVAITQSGINLSGNLPYNGNAAVGLGYAQYSDQSGLLAPSTTKAVYSKGGDLYWNDGNGNQVRMTASGAVNTGATGSIGGMDGSSALTYTTGNKTFTFSQSSAFPAKVAHGDMLIYQTANGAANAVTLQNPGVASAYTLQLPAALPATPALLQSTATGALGFVAPPSAANALLQGTPAGVLSYVTTLPVGLILPGATVTTPAFGVNDGGLCPTGTVVEYSGFSAPSGWLLCDGTSYTVAGFAALAAILTIITTGTTNGTTIITGIPSTIGMDVGMPVLGANIPGGTTVTTIDSATQIHISQAASGSTTGGTLYVAPYGAADTGHFNVPDFRGRAAIGVGTGTTLTKRVAGTGGGEETHVLSIAEMPSHTHDLIAGAPTVRFIQASGPANGGGTNTSTASNTATGTQPQGGGTAHNNMPPFLPINRIIRT